MENIIQTEEKAITETQQPARIPQRGPVPEANITPSLVRKLAKARKMISDGGLCKGGVNAFIKKKDAQGKEQSMQYFELADFVPQIIRTEEALGLLSVPYYDVERCEAYLSIYDCEGAGVAVCNCPLGALTRTGIQDMGAIQTYARRYLFLSAYQITESDMLDASLGASDEERAKLIEQLRGMGTDINDVAKAYSTKPAKLTSGQLLDAVERKKKKLERQAVKSASQMVLEKAGRQNGKNAETDGGKTDKESHQENPQEKPEA